MEANHSPSHDVAKTKHQQEGPRKHLLAFLMSIFLTILAFIAVAYRDVLDSNFVPMFIVALALIQALVQALFWMHLKDRGHFQQRLFIACGAAVAFAAAYTAIEWMWW